MNAVDLLLDLFSFDSSKSIDFLWLKVTLLQADSLVSVAVKTLFSAILTLTDFDCSNVHHTFRRAEAEHWGILRSGFRLSHRTNRGVGGVCPVCSARVLSLFTTVRY